MNSDLIPLRRGATMVTLISDLFHAFARTSVAHTKFEFSNHHHHHHNLLISQKRTSVNLDARLAAVAPSDAGRNAPGPNPSPYASTSERKSDDPQPSRSSGRPSTRGRPKPWP